MPRLALALPLVLSLALVGCKATIADVSKGGDVGGDGGAAASCPSMALSTTALSWQGAPIGVGWTEPLTVTNDCAATGAEGEDLQLTLVWTADTSTAFDAPDMPSEVSLAPGESLVVDVTFTAPGYEPQVGTLLATPLGEASVAVALSGEAAADQDGDGHAALDAGGDDCDDFDPDVMPGDGEVARDGADDDCDGLVDEDYIQPGDVIISEIMANPTMVGDAYGEWFEVTNTTDVDVDLHGWQVSADDGEGFTIGAHLVVPPGGYAVLGVSGDVGTNGGVTVDLAYDRAEFSLADWSDSIFLSVAGRAVADVSYGDGWLISEGRSISLDREFYDPYSAGISDYWCTGVPVYGDGDRGTPGDTNSRCATVDHDGDGYSNATGDCDDDDASLSPGAAEVWDGVDNDCDGAADQLSSGAAAGVLEGGSDDYLGWASSLSVADLDGDGVADVAAGGLAAGPGTTGTASYGSGMVWVVDGGTAMAAAGAIEDHDFASLEGGNRYNMLASMAPSQGDVTGDGVPDLLVAGTDRYATYGQGPATAAVLLFGGAGLSGDTAHDEGDVLFTGSKGFSANSQPAFHGMGHGDYDGDGHADPVYADWYAASGTPTGGYYRGEVYAFSGGDLHRGDSLDLATSADLMLRGVSDGDALGSALGAGDVDGDGYDDLVLGCMACDVATPQAGGVFVVPGGSGRWTGSGLVTSHASVAIGNDMGVAGLGTQAFMPVADFDEDGRADLVLAAPTTGEVYVVLDAQALGPSNALSAVIDVELQGDGPENFGATLAAGDVSGDGVADLVVGAPDVRAMSGWAPADQEGAVYVFDGTGIGGSAQVQASNADFILWSDDTDGFGLSLSTGDTDGDGVDEVVVAAPGFDGDMGAVYLFDL